MARARVDRANTDRPGLSLGVDWAWEIHSGCFLTLGCAIRDWKQPVPPTRGDLPSVPSHIQAYLSLLGTGWHSLARPREALLEPGPAENCMLPF